jgi:hypothetical protein
MTPEELSKIMEKYQSGDYTLTKEEFDQLLEASGKPTAQEKIAKQLGLGSTEELQAQISDILQQAKNSPNYFQRLERKIKRGETTADLAAGFNVVRDLTQGFIGSRQVSASNRALARNQRPALPGLPPADPRLDQAISEAQRGTMDAARMVEPARQGIERGFASDLTAARGAVGGQASAYGALAQTAALRRNRGFAELAPVIDSVRAREQARLDDLLARRGQQRQQDFGNRMQLYDFANQNYQQDANAAAELGLAGRENMYGAINSLPDSLAAYGGTFADRQFNVPNVRNPFQRKTLPPEHKTQVPELDAVQEELMNTSLLYNPDKYQRQQPYNRYQA